MKAVLKGEAAKIFYDAVTNNNDENILKHKYRDFGSDFAGIGGYFSCENDPSTYFSFYFSQGKEVFIEECLDIESAIEWAIGHADYYGF